MAKWAEIPDYKKLYEELFVKYTKLQKEVKCDYYEAYLKERLRSERLEKDLEDYKPRSNY
jgi:hypothetical protein